MRPRLTNRMEALAEKIVEIAFVLMNSSAPRRINDKDVQFENKRIACDPAVTAIVIARTSVPLYFEMAQTVIKETIAELNCVTILKV